jgi:hypothetical protein
MHYDKTVAKIKNWARGDADTAKLVRLASRYLKNHPELRPNL